MEMQRVQSSILRNEPSAIAVPLPKSAMNALFFVSFAPMVAAIAVLSWIVKNMFFYTSAHIAAGIGTLLFIVVLNFARFFYFSPYFSDLSHRR